MAPSAHDEESEPSDGDARANVVVVDHMSEGEQERSPLNLQPTDSVQGESTACGTFDLLLSSSPPPRGMIDSTLVPAPLATSKKNSSSSSTSV